MFLTTGLLLGFLLGVPNLGPNNAPIKSELFLERFFRLNVFVTNLRASLFRFVRLSRLPIMIWSSWGEKTAIYLARY